MKKKKKQSLESRQVKSGYLFTLPFLIGSSFFVIFPIIISIVFSLSHVSNDSSGYTVDFLGLDNYKYMLMSDPNYNQTVLNTLKTMLINGYLMIRKLIIWLMLKFLILTSVQRKCFSSCLNQ